MSGSSIFSLAKTYDEEFNNRNVKLDIVMTICTSQCGIPQKTKGKMLENVLFFQVHVQMLLDKRLCTAFVITTASCMHSEIFYEKKICRF